VPEAAYTVTQGDGELTLNGTGLRAADLILYPVDGAKGRFTIHGVTIGIQFHWERKESQTFQGSLRLEARPQGISVINEIPIESYLTSVISSEMSASSPGELLRSHAIVSRSWLLFQLRPRVSSEPEAGPNQSLGEIIRWYDRENHCEFDVCADDHCQRYQGITKAHSPAVFEAINDTRGQVLTYAGQICDARYSKSCGGMTEAYGAAWQDMSVPYLSPVYDGPDTLEGYGLPLRVEANAERWIRSTPAAFCNIRSRELLAQILPGFDQETPDFYRWRVDYTAEEVSGLVRDRLGIDCGPILDLSPVLRGDSGRIIKLRITGADKSVVRGKESEI